MKFNFQDPCLVIDTSSNLISISIHDKNDFDIINQNCDTNITEHILPIIDNLLKKNNLKINNIKCIIYSQGPGSFTSLRLGLSISKGLSLPFNIPLIGIPKLDVIAFKAKDLNIRCKTILSYIRATKNEFFYAIYESESFSLKKDYEISKIDDILKEFSSIKIFIGNVELKYNLNNNKNIIFNPKANDYFNMAKKNNYATTDCEKANLLYIRNKIALTIKEQLLNADKTCKY